MAKTNSNGAIHNKPKGVVIGIDKLQIYPIPGATLLGNTDFTTKETQDKIKKLLNEKKVDCVLSDMAPNSSGIKCLDQQVIMDLCHSVLQFAIEMSAPNGVLLVKVWENGEVNQFEKLCLNYYESVKAVKPNASRADSAEKFILAKGFRGPISK